MLSTETRLTILAGLFDLEARTIHALGGTFEMHIGDGVLRYQSWNDKYFARGGHEITAKDVAVYLSVWQDNRDAHPDHLMWLMREALAV